MGWRGPELDATYTQSPPPGVAVGQEAEYGGDIYKFVHLQATSGSVAVNGLLFQLAASNEGEVTDDVANSSANLALGVAQAAITADSTYGNYFWVKKIGFGIDAATTTASVIAVGDALVANSAGAAVVPVAGGTAPTHRVVSWATEAVSTGTIAAAGDLCCGMNKALG